jgi:hypothetical protein
VLRLEDGHRGKPRRERSATTVSTARGPQHAYAADPGTITGWIVLVSKCGVPLLAELLYVWNIMNPFYNMPADRASQVCQDQVADMVHSALGGDRLCPFLTVTTFKGQEAVVSVMIRIGKNVGRLGYQAGYLHGNNALGNLGKFDVATEQMTTRLKLPDGTMVKALVPSSVTTVPMVASVTAQYQALASLHEEAFKLVDVQIGADNSDEMAFQGLRLSKHCGSHFV